MKQTKAVITNERYMALVEELQALKTEEQFDFGTRHVFWAHQWGRVLREHVPSSSKATLKRGGSDLEATLQRVSKDVGRSVRMLRNYVELYDRYPDIQEGLNEHGKSVSVRKLLGTSEAIGEIDDRPPCEHSCARHCK